MREKPASNMAVGGCLAETGASPTEEEVKRDSCVWRAESGDDGPTILVGGASVRDAGG